MSHHLGAAQVCTELLSYFTQGQEMDLNTKADDLPLGPQTKIGFSLSVENTAQCAIFTRSSETLQSYCNSYTCIIHQRFTVSQQNSLRYLGHIQPHTHSHRPLQLISFSPRGGDWWALFEAAAWVFVRACVRVLVVICCYWVSLPVCSHSHSHSFSLSSSSSHLSHTYYLV